MPVTVNLIHQDSGRQEWYTPWPVIEAARAFMGEITLDPASSAAANETVRATVYYTVADDGLGKPWHGRVWLNPPFAEVAGFVARVCDEYEAGRIAEACVLTFASLDTAWARRLMRYPRWYPAGRLAYVPGWEAQAAAQSALPLPLAEWPQVASLVIPAADAPPKASMVTYLGPWERVHRFGEVFTGRLGGTVDVPLAAVALLAARGGGR